ncbi:MAG: hypothetical protein AAB426_10115, partial [Myxococcota bacterium]
TEQELIVTNGTEKPLTFRASARDYGLDARGEEYFANAGTLPGTMASWLSFLPREITVPPKSQRPIRVVISVPADATGGHYALVLVQTETDVPGAEGKGMAMSAGLGVKLYLATSARIHPRLEVKQAKVNPPTPHERMGVVVDVANTGDVHVEPTAQMVIIDGQGNLAGRADGGPIGTLLPGQRGQARLEWGGELAPGSYSVIVTITYAGDGSLVVEQPLVVGAPRR